MSRWLGIRPGERRDVAFGFATLVLVIAGHAMLENARDTLFLSELPVTTLPWAYLAIAALSLLVAGGINLLPAAADRGRVLALTLLGAAAVDAAFFALVATHRPEALFALYVWTGVAASLVTLQLWLRVGDVFDVGRAKRAFAVIAAGGLLGASAGAALAGVLLRWIPPRGLILAGGTLFVVAAAVERRWSAGGAGRTRAAAPEPDGRPLLQFDAYLGTVLGLTLVASVVVTGVDYLFKAAVAHSVPRARLGTFLAHYHTVVNATALAFQLFVAPRLLQGFGVVGSLAILPTLLLLGTGAAAIVGGIAPVLLAKAADGTLRHSLDRAGTEILHLPLADGVRDRFKAVTTAVGQRGGQAIASVAILLLLASGASARGMAASIAVLSALWCATVVVLWPRYVGRFRAQLRGLGLGLRGVLPPLDLPSLEALLMALRSADDAELLAALDVLEAYDKTHLVSPLMVHHPSPAVARRVLGLFTTSMDAELLRLLDRMLPHDDGDVRAAVLRMRTASHPDETLLRRHLRDTRSAAVRCTALVGLVAGGFLEDREAEDALRQVLRDATADACPTIARALHDLPPRFARPLAHELSRNPDPRFAAEVAKAIAEEPNALFLETLIESLARRDARAHARTALVALGEVALERLSQALADRDTPAAVRLHLPRTISRFASPVAATGLVEQLAREDDDRVRYKILRALGRMRTDDPAMPVDAERLLDVAEALLARAVTVLSHRVGVALLYDGGGASALLVPLLEEEERHALENVFRVLHVLDPEAGYAVVSRGLAGRDALLRAGGRELLENILRGPLRQGLLALTDGLPPAARLAAALDVHEPPGSRALVALGAGTPAEDSDRPALAAAVRAALLVDPSALVRSVAQYEIGLPGAETRPHGA